MYQELLGKWIASEEGNNVLKNHPSNTEALVEFASWLEWCAAQQSAHVDLLTPCPACCSADKKCPICSGTCVKPQSG